jgi:hypothetical protein
VILRKGQTYYRSEVGHYTIHYPSTVEYELLISIEVEQLPWLTPEGFKVYKVIAPKDYMKETVLWIKDLPV